MKKTILAGFMFLLFSGVAMAAEFPSFPFVFVSGEAEQEAAPDKATVSFRVVVFDKDPDKALAAVTQRSAELMAIFKKYGIADEDVVAYEINKETVRERKDNVALGILGYELTRRMSVTLRKLDPFGGLMSEIVNLANVEKVKTVFDTARRKEIEAELFKKAAQKAREQAELLARGFGSQITHVQAIAASHVGFGGIGGEFGFEGTYRGYAVAAKAAMPEQSINVFVPHAIKLKASVSAIFRLK